MILGIRDAERDYESLAAELREAVEGANLASPSAPPAFGGGTGCAFCLVLTGISSLDEPAQPTVAAYLGAGLPKDLRPESIAGDGFDGNTIYVGTNQGGVYRWDGTQPYWLAWTPYNRCFPKTVNVRDLLVEPSRKELRAGTWGRGAWSVVTGP